MCNSFALQSTVNHLHVLRVSILEFRFMVTIFEIEDTQLHPLFVSGILWVAPLLCTKDNTATGYETLHSN
jgi:hypothetical protein